MADNEPPPSIADASKPNAGRIYDYLLGGNHNFEVDRIAGEELRKRSPEMPKVFRLIRWFLGEATRRLSEKGFTYFLDFASGLPTIDHIHVTAPEGTRVVYSDLDPVTVSYGQELTKGLSGVRYIQCDAGRPEESLTSEAVSEVFGNERKAAIGYNGILWFLPDDRFAHAMKTLYEWADKGSMVYLTTDNTPDAVLSSPQYKKLSETYSRLSQPMFPKNLEKVERLAQPWKPAWGGFKTVEEWLDLGDKVGEELAEKWRGLGLYGGFLIKE